MSKFCCDKFQFHHGGDTTMGLKILVLSIGDSFAERDLSQRKRLRFFITEGFIDLNENTQLAMIDYCPFCGQKLEAFYSSEKYINIENHPFNS